MKKSKYTFSEVTDLIMHVDFSIGSDVGEFVNGSTKRELFIIYEGPKMAENKDEFFKELQKFIAAR